MEQKIAKNDLQIEMLKSAHFEGTGQILVNAVGKHLGMRGAEQFIPILEFCAVILDFDPQASSSN